MKYVIIGNSAAAVGCVEGIRQNDQEGEIVLIASEPHHTYSRPLISYLLGGKTDEERMRYRPRSFYEENRVSPMLGETVEGIAPEKKAVRLQSGKTVFYDKLLVATGSTPFIPQIEGLESIKQRFTFTTLEDAKALEQAVDSRSRVLILGAGLIGLKCAEGLFHRTRQITVVDMADHILPSILVRQAAELVENHIRSQGVELVLSDSAARFEGNRAVLRSGKEVEFDTLVVAVGVRPNTKLVSDAGGAVNRGIQVDEYCRTSLQDVYAAGDCTESVDITTGERKVLALLPGAYLQGETAGRHMAMASPTADTVGVGSAGTAPVKAGVPGAVSAAALPAAEVEPYDKAIPMNAIGFFGLHMITAGSYCGESYTAPEPDGYKQLIWRDNRLVGYIMIGNVVRAGIYTSLIRDQVPLDSVDFELIREKPQLMAFSRRERREKLGV